MITPLPRFLRRADAPRALQALPEKNAFDCLVCESLDPANVAGVYPERRRRARDLLRLTHEGPSALTARAMQFTDCELYISPSASPDQSACFGKTGIACPVCELRTPHRGLHDGPSAHIARTIQCPDCELYISQPASPDQSACLGKTRNACPVCELYNLRPAQLGGVDPNFDDAIVCPVCELRSSGLRQKADKGVVNEAAIQCLVCELRRLAPPARHPLSCAQTGVGGNRAWRWAASWAILGCGFSASLLASAQV